MTLFAKLIFVSASWCPIYLLAAVLAWDDNKALSFGAAALAVCSLLGISFVEKFVRRRHAKEYLTVASCTHKKDDISDNRYVIQDTREAVYLPDQLDFFCYNGIIFAINWDSLEKVVNFREVTRAKAQGHWNTFTQEVPVHAPERIWTTLNKSIRLLNTVNRAFSQPRRVAPDLSRIQAFIVSRNLNIECRDGILVIDENDRTQVLHLMTILADGYVTSDLTDRHLRTFDAEDV